MAINIIDAIEDDALFRNYLAIDGDLASWQNWLTMLRALYGLPLSPEEHECVRLNTGRDPLLMPTDGFKRSLILAGRRSGKSRICGLIAAFESVLSGRHLNLASGETGIVAVISPTRDQSEIVGQYIRAAFSSSPILRNEVAEERKDVLALKNGIEIRTLTGSFKSVRGYSLCCAILDEIAFFSWEEESKLTDDELVAAVRPGLLTTGGKLIAVGSPYAEFGFSHATWKRGWANNNSQWLVWNSPSTAMNQTLDESEIAEQIAEDPDKFNVEYVTQRGLFRKGASQLITRAAVEACVVKRRTELAASPGVPYCAFIDMAQGQSGDGGDDACLAIAHVRDEDIVVIDKLVAVRPPFMPDRVVAEFAQVCRTYGVDTVLADAEALGYNKMQFARWGINYERVATSEWKSGASASKPVRITKSDLYLELLPRLIDRRIELLDDERSVKQIAALQRRLRIGTKDRIDHPAGEHDDSANVIAGAAHAATRPSFSAGLIDRNEEHLSTPYSAFQAEWDMLQYRQAEYATEQQHMRESYNGPVVPGSVKWGPEHPLVESNEPLHRPNAGPYV